jgi:glycosyltransferase involved in cell wall biosynthesis
MRISILLPGYNVEKHIRETLDSIVDQTFKDYELVYIDDASQDKSVEIVESYRERLSSLRVVRNKENKKLATTLNIGLRNCQGEYIFRIDADDLLVPETLQRMNQALLDNPEINGVVCDRHHINEDGSDKRISLTLTEDYYLKKAILFITAFGGQPCLIKRDIWLEAGLHD